MTLHLTSAPSVRRVLAASILLGQATWLLMLTGCANPALRSADELAQAGRHREALELIEEAGQVDPKDRDLQLARIRHRERAASQLAVQTEMLRQAGKLAEAQALLEQLKSIDPRNPRLPGLVAEVARAQRQERLLAEARSALQAGRLDHAEARARDILGESPSHPAARQLLLQLAERQSKEGAGLPTELAPAFQRPVTLEFRDAPLRNVFEALARTSNLNFVFDREVRADSRVTVYLKNVSIDEALRVVLSTQQLDRKVLNGETLLIYPNSPNKQRELQDLQSRTLYLGNTSAKEAEKLVKTIAKVRDVHVDERVNALVIRDTPEVLRLVERLLASVDIPEPEVMLEVEVLEVASDAMDAIGLQWAEQLQYGLPGGAGTVLTGQRGDFRAMVANPLVTATLRGTSGSSNLLANPRIRVRNREKAKVQIGEKLPIFTTTSAINIGVSTSVSYLDVGLKLDVEPTVGTDNEVGLKIALEVSNLLGQVSGPSGSVAYQVGTRLTNTALRLADGETQIISGLISDEDRRTAAGVPGLSRLPVAGALFGLRSNTQSKTEIVLLLTPRIIRGMAVPDASFTRVPAGNEANPGAFHTQLRPGGKAGVGWSGGAAAATVPARAPVPAPPVRAPAAVGAASADGNED